MRKIDWDTFAITNRNGHRPMVPALSCFFYLTGGLHEMANELADGLERYVGFVGADVFKSSPIRSGEWKPMTKKKVARDLKYLRNFPRDHVGCPVRYEAGEGGEPGGFGVHIEGYADGYMDDVFPNRMNLLRIDFPAAWLDDQDDQAFVDLFADICRLPHVQSARAGFTFKTTPGSQSDAAQGIYERLPRYLGFSHCDFSHEYWMLGHTFTAHWLNYLDADLTKAVGGPAAMGKVLSKCELRSVKKGVVIRGAKLPPIGEVDREAQDLGQLPAIARLLEPTRFDFRKTYLDVGGPMFMAKWMARFDDLDVRSWDNSDSF